MNATRAVSTAVLVLATVASHGCQGPGSAFSGLTLRRGGQPHRYRLTTTQNSAAGATETIVTFDLTSTESGDEYVTLRSALVRDLESGEAAPLTVSGDCRQAFEGDAASLGGFTLATGTIAFDELVPPCIPEPLFIAVMDIVGFLEVQLHQDPSGNQIMLAVGDEVRTPPLKTSWKRPPEVVSGSLTCPGGTTRLERIEAGAAYVQWTADPITISVVRAVPGVRDVNMLLAGTESFAMELVIDAKEGTLLAARSLHDTVIASVWMPYEGTSAPAMDGWPDEPGRTMAISRELVLEMTD